MYIRDVNLGDFGGSYMKTKSVFNQLLGNTEAIRSFHRHSSVALPSVSWFGFCVIT